MRQYQAQVQQAAFAAQQRYEQEIAQRKYQVDKARYEQELQVYNRALQAQQQYQQAQAQQRRR